MPTLFQARLKRNLINTINCEIQGCEALSSLQCMVPPLSPVVDIAVVNVNRLSNEDRPLEGAPDWMIEMRSPDQSTLDLQNKYVFQWKGGPNRSTFFHIQC